MYRPLSIPFFSMSVICGATTNPRISHCRDRNKVQRRDPITGNGLLQTVLRIYQKVKFFVCLFFNDYINYIIVPIPFPGKRFFHMFLFHLFQRKDTDTCDRILQTVNSTYHGSQKRYYKVTRWPFCMISKHLLETI